MCIVIISLFVVNFFFPDFDKLSASAIELDHPVESAPECVITTAPAAYLSVTGEADDKSTEAVHNDIFIRDYEVQTKTCNAVSYSLGINGDNTLTSTGDTITAVDINGTTLAEDPKESAWGYRFAENKGAKTDAYENFLIYVKPKGAVWTTPDDQIIESGIMYMQDIGDTIIDGGFCGNSIPVKSTITLKDYRDGKSYEIAKVADGVCWMKSNLKLPGGTELTYSNSNLNSDGDTYTIPDDSSKEANGGTSTWVNDYCKPYMAVSGGEYYYNWPAATARTNSTTGSSSCSDDASNSVGDICPKDWRLPISAETTDSTWRSNIQPVSNFAYAGYFRSGSVNLGTSISYWWTSTRYDNTYAHDMYYQNSITNASRGYKGDGFFVRCLSDSGTSTGTGDSSLSNVDTPITAPGYKEILTKEGTTTDELTENHLTFGVKFGNEAVPGEYTSKVSLLLAAMPGPEVNYQVTYKCMGNATIGTVQGCSDSDNVDLVGHRYDYAYTTLSAPSLTGYDFQHWSGSDGKTYQAGATVALSSDNPSITLTAVWQAKTYTITFGTATGISSVSLEGQNCATATCTKTLTYGETYTLTATAATGYTFSTWSKSSGAGTLASATSATAAKFTVGDGDAKLTPSATANYYTCTKRYRLQNADGTWSGYTNDGTEQVQYNETCSYTKQINDYKPSASGTNNAGTTASKTMNSTSGITVDIDFYRNTYTLTVNRNSTYISSASATTSAVHGSNYYRWGQSVNITATASSGNKFTSWSQSGTAGTFGDANSASTTFTMGKGDATVTAGGEADTLSPDQITSSTNCGKDMVDTRGRVSNTYGTVSINGKCWMTSNLKLPGGTKLTSDDSNVTSEYTIPSDTWVNDYCRPRMAVSGGEYYYNWPAATARTNSTTGSSSCSNDTDNSLGDICPKGWRLPTYNDEINNYTWRSAVQSSGNLGYTGSFNSGSAGNVGSSGYWWTSTRNSNNGAYAMYYNSGAAYSGNRAKYLGFSVRCVVK